MIDNLSLMLSHFPKYKEEVESLFIKDKYFMAVVNDYLLCKKQIKMLTDSNKAEQAMAYNDTINELEQDLLAILERHKLIKS
jgi:hypothetical protein